MSQRALMSQVNAIKRRVRDEIGTDLSYEFRNSQVYLNYCSLCGEAVMAYEDEELDEQLVAMLEDCAEEVIKLNNRNNAGYTNS